MEKAEHYNELSEHIPDIPSSAADLEQMWQQSEVRAAEAHEKIAGKGGFSLRKKLRDSRSDIIDWKDLMRQFMKANVKTKRSWKHPDPRLM